MVFVSGRAATGGARLNLEARALAAVAGVNVERRGKRGEQYIERSGRRTPPPYNRPRSHRAATATFGRIGPSTFKRLARFLVTWLFRVAGLWLRLGCCDRSGAFPERGGRGRRK